MNKKIVRAAFAAILLGTTASVAMVAFPASAADENKSDQKVSRDVAKPLSEAQKAAQSKDWTTAMAKVKEAQAVSDKTPFDEYKIDQFMAFIAVNQQDYPTATTAYEAMAASPAEDPADKAGTRHNLVLLTSAIKDYPKTIQYGEELAAMGKADDKVAETLSQAYYFTNNYQKAAEWSKKVVDGEIAANKVPDKNSLSVLMSSQAKLGDQVEAEKTLELLTVNYGNPSDWAQLTDIALGTKGIQNPDGLDLYRLRVTAGAMKEADDYAQMANLALHLGYPGEAKAVLSQGAATGGVNTSSGNAGKLYKSAVQGAASDDKTLPAFAKQAAARKNGDYDEKLAETYFGYQRYDEAETVARRALSKPGGKDPQQVRIVLGMSQARQGKYQDAIATFKDVENADGRAARVKVAHLWSLYCQSKLPKTDTAAAAPAAQPAPQQQQ